jgi:hypothetical protein
MPFSDYMDYFVDTFIAEEQERGEDGRDERLLALAPSDRKAVITEMQMQGLLRSPWIYTRNGRTYYGDGSYRETTTRR